MGFAFIRGLVFHPIETMARNYTFVRQEAEALVDLCEANPDFQIHDRTALQFAAELRELFGMATREKEMEHRNRNE